MAENNARAKRKIKTRMNKFCEEYNAQTGSIISSKITPRLPLGREQGEDFDPLPLPTSEVLYEEDSYETENNGCTERLDTLTLECDELQEYSEELDEKVLGSVIGKFTTHASDLYTFSEEEKEVNIMSIEEEEFEKDLNNFRPHQNTNIHGLHVGDVHLPPLDTEGNELIDDTPLLSPVASSINFPNLVKSSTSQQQGGVASVHHIAMQEIRANINIFLEWGEAKNRLLQDYKQTENKDFKTMFAYNEFSMSDFNTFDIHGIQAEKFTYAGWRYIYILYIHINIYIYIYIYIYNNLSHRPVTLHMNYPEKKIFWRRKRQHFFNHCGTIDITKINGFLLGLQSYTFRKRFLPEEIEKIGTLPLLIPYECVSFVGETRTYDFVIPNHEQKIKFLLAIISLLRDKQEKSNKKKEKIKQIELPSYYDILILQIKLKIEYIAMLAKKNKCLLFMVEHIY